MLKSGIIYFVGRISAALIVLLSISIYTRLLSPAEYGVYALIVSGVTITYAAAMQWLTSSLGRFLPAYRDREEIILSHVAASYSAIALVVVLSVLLVVPLLELDASALNLLVLAVIFFLAMSFAEFNLVVFQMRGQPLIYTGFTVSRVGVAATIGIVLAYYGWGSVGLLVGLVVGNLSIVLPNLIMSWRAVRFKLLQKRLLAELATYGFPSAMTGALGAVISVSDRYIIDFFMGTDATGLYAAPYDLVMRSLHVLMMAVAMACFPVIFHVYEAKGRAGVEPLIRRQAELLLGVALPAAIAFIMLSPAITFIFLGREFQQTARELIPWIAAATVLSGFQAFYLSLAFSLPKQPLRQFYVFVAGAVVNAVLNFLLIPRFGLIGAALATVAAYALIMAGSLLVGRRLYPLPFSITGLAKVLTACATLVLILWPVSDTTAVPRVILHGLAGATVYAIIVCSLDVAQSRRPFSRALQLGYAYVRTQPAGLERPEVHRLAGRCVMVRLLGRGARL